MKTVIFFILFFLSVSAFSQRSLLDSLKVDKTTKIIGQSDFSEYYRAYDFLIEDSLQVEAFISFLKLGNETKGVAEQYTFQLIVVKDHKNIGSWTIYPNSDNVSTHDEHSYQIDLKYISELHKTYPVTYYKEQKDFRTEAEYKNYYAMQKNDPKFLFAYSPDFRREGSFEIEFRKSSSMSSPRAISDFLIPYIEEIVNRKDYDLTYIVNDRNFYNQQQFTMTVAGPEKLYKELHVANLKNMNWKPNVGQAYFFYRK